MYTSQQLRRSSSASERATHHDEEHVSSSDREANYSEYFRDELTSTRSSQRTDHLSDPLVDTMLGATTRRQNRRSGVLLAIWGPRRSRSPRKAHRSTVAHCRHSRQHHSKKIHAIMDGKELGLVFQIDTNYFHGIVNGKGLSLSLSERTYC